MAEEDKQEDIEPIPEVPPIPIAFLGSTDITFIGEEIERGVGPNENFGLAPLERGVLEDIAEGKGFDPEDPEVKQSIDDALVIINEAIARDQQTDLDLTLDAAGKLVQVPGMGEEVDDPDLQEDQNHGDVKEDKADEVESPKDPGGDTAPPDPDPLVPGSVIQMPDTKNGADAYWKLRDSASDGVSLFAADLKEAIEAKAFGTEKSPYPPLYNGGSFVAGYDKNSKLVIYYITAVAGNYQTKLEDLRAAVGAFVVDVNYLGVASSAQVQMLLIPTYNEGAGGCGDACADDSLAFELHPRTGDHLTGYHYDAASSGGSWNDEERAGGATRNDTFDIYTDSAGLSLGTCGITLRMVEYVSVASSMSLHRLLTFDKCGKLTNVSAAIETAITLPAAASSTHTHTVDVTTGSSTQATSAPVG